jgi:hypothetical protein
VPWTRQGHPAAGSRSTRAAAVLAAVSFLIPAAGCGSDSPAVGAGWAVVVDTLATGAVRVVNVPPPSGIEPRWVLEEGLRIGSVDGDGPASFGQIKGLVVDDDERIIVLDAQAQEIRVFGPDGGYLRTLGRRGEGPGELRNANGLMLGRDGRLRVPDPQLGRLSVFDVERGFEESYAWPVRQWGWVWDGALAADGRVLVPSYATWDGERWDAVLVFAAGMRLLDSIPIQPAPWTPDTDFPSAFRWQSGQLMGFVGVPFYAQARKVLTDGPAYWLTVDGDPRYRIARWVAGGDTTLVVETRRPSVAVTAAERDSAIASVRDFLRERNADTRQDWSKIPAVHPAVLGLFLSADGDVWARVTTPDPAFTVWDVYAPDGRYRGTAVTDLRPYPWVSPVVRGHRFWAVVVDELDVPYVVAARLVDGPGWK